MTLAATPAATLESRRLRLTTLTRLRWLAVFGQSTAVGFVAVVLEFPIQLSLCLALIACSAWLNLFLSLRYRPTFRLEPLAGFALLGFDTLQLAGLLFLTGGITNPFAVLLIIPAIIAAASLPWRYAVLLGLLVIIATTALVFVHLPLPWFPGMRIALPYVYLAGIWLAVVAAIIFAGLYAWRVTEEARQLADALSATELVLQRETHLTALDGLAAAAAHELGTPLATIALVAREMEKQLAGDPRHAEDVALLRSQSERCREILKRITTLSSTDAEVMTSLSLAGLIEEVVGPYREFGVAIRIVTGPTDGAEPTMRRSPGVIHGLGNVIENAVDFAREEVVVTKSWSRDTIRLVISDDGPGISLAMLDRIGEPYATSRPGGGENGGGLGLGVFIARTLLERSGAEVTFANARDARRGAEVMVAWPRNSPIWTIAADAPAGVALENRDVSAS